MEHLKHEKRQMSTLMETIDCGLSFCQIDVEFSFIHHAKKRKQTNVTILHFFASNDGYHVLYTETK